jgi:hypothetical protein
MTIQRNVLHASTAAFILGYMLLHHRMLQAGMTAHIHDMEQKEQFGQHILPCHVSSRNKTPSIQTQEAITPHSMSQSIEWLPPCNVSTTPFWNECAPGPDSIDVVLTVYRRPNLRFQLEMVVNQTLLPQNILIYQSEHYFQVQPILQDFHKQFPNFRVPIHLVHAPIDSAGYHGRFYSAYILSKARYISVWDDDLTVGAGWLKRVKQFLHSQNDTMIVSSGGRLVDSILDPSTETKQNYGTLQKRKGEVDFCVHNYNLRRELLRYWLGSPVYTYYTGEDMQLAFSLQKYGIRAYKLGGRPNKNDYADGSVGLGANNRKASYKKKRLEPRQWLLCKLVLEGFQTKQCSNCNAETAKRCLDYFESMGLYGQNK